MSGGQLISIHPEELTFEVELEKPASCNLMIVNHCPYHVALKAMTTAPRKFSALPYISVVLPWDSCTITVILEAQKEYPPDMQSDGIFILQSTIVEPTIVHFDDIPLDTFMKSEGKVVEESVLRIVFVTPKSGNAESVIASATKPIMEGSDVLALQRLRKERDFILQQSRRLEREAEGEERAAGELTRRRRGCLWRRRQFSETFLGGNRSGSLGKIEVRELKRLRKERVSILEQNEMMQHELEMRPTGFSLTFAAIVGLVGLFVGFMLKFVLS